MSLLLFAPGGRCVISLRCLGEVALYQFCGVSANIVFVYRIPIVSIKETHRIFTAHIIRRGGNVLLLRL